MQETLNQIDSPPYLRWRALSWLRICRRGILNPPPPPQKEPFLVLFCVQNVTQCSETNEKSIFRYMRFLFFEVWVFLYSKLVIFSIFGKKLKYDFSFDSKLCASFIQTWPLLRGVCISLVGKNAPHETVGKKINFAPILMKYFLHTCQIILSKKNFVEMFFCRNIYIFFDEFFFCIYTLFKLFLHTFRSTMAVRRTIKKGTGKI